MSKTTEEAVRELMGSNESEEPLTRETEVQVDYDDEDDGASSVIDDDEMSPNKLVSSDDDEGVEESSSEEGEEGEEVEEGESLDGDEPDLTVAELQGQVRALHLERDRIKRQRYQSEERVEALQRQIDEVQKHLEEVGREPTPEAMEKDPIGRHINERLRRLEERGEQARDNARTPEDMSREAIRRPDVEEHPPVTQELVREVATFGKSSAQAMKSQTPDGYFDEAYVFALQKLQEETGFNKDQMENLELGLLYEAMQRGADPAVETVKFAKSKGWKFRGGQNGGEDNEGAALQPSGESKVRRLRDGVKSSRASSPDSSRRSDRGSATISREKFYSMTDESTRMAIYAKYPDAFKELATTDAISRRFLPKQ